MELLQLRGFDYLRTGSGLDVDLEGCFGEAMGRLWIEGVEDVGVGKRLGAQLEGMVREGVEGL